MENKAQIKFSFPKFIKADNILVQFNKILEEIDEFEQDFTHGNKVQYDGLVELLDALHAIETFIRYYADEKDVDKAYGYVLRKNAERGYYMASVCCAILSDE